MEMRLDQDAWRTDATPGESRDNPGDRPDGRPEWTGLRARLLATGAALAALDGEGRLGPCRPPGSFDPRSAQLIATYGESLAAVNPNTLGNGKPDRAMDAQAADAPLIGDRG